MAGRKTLLATLSSLALTSAGATAAHASGLDMDLPPPPPQSAFYGLVTQLAESCLVERPQGYEVAFGDVRIAQCCAVIREVGPENTDFLQAVALGNPADPRLAPLDGELVAVLLSCQQEALDRLADLALTFRPAAGPTNTLYTG